MRGAVKAEMIGTPQYMLNALGANRTANHEDWNVLEAVD